VGLARRGSRQTSNNEETVEEITEADIKAQVQKQANRVMLKSFITAAVITAVALLLPNFAR